MTAHVILVIWQSLSIGTNCAITSSVWGVQVTDFITDNVTEVWIDFVYRGQRFSVNNQFGEYWFFVDKPRCSEEILEAVLGHCELVLVSA